MDSLTCRGIIHGKTIELDGATGLPEGQPVTIIVQPAEYAQVSPLAGDGIRRSAGGWADDGEELEKFLAWNRQQRKATRSPAEDES